MYHLVGVPLHIGHGNGGHREITATFCRHTEKKTRKVDCHISCRFINKEAIIDVLFGSFHLLDKSLKFSFRFLTVPLRFWKLF